MDLQNQNRIIPAGNPPEKSLDYEFLRESGIKYLEQFTGQAWSDYNIHDPGITILETLCYALTEIGLKVNQPIQDIIASSSGPVDGILNLVNLLSSEPLTLIDFRKILVDLPGIKNAWLTLWTKKAEISFYYNQDNINLNYTNGQLIKPKGLWETLFEFSDESLNTNVISRPLAPIDDREYLIDIVFPYWDQLDTNSAGTDSLSISSVSFVEIPGESSGTVIRINGQDEYLVILQIGYDGGHVDEFPIYIKVIPGVLSSHIPVFEDQNPGTNPILQLLNSSTSGSILDDFNTKNNASRNQVIELRNYLNSRRNLGEDFTFFKTVRTQEVAIRADFELHPDSAVIDTLAEILFQIDQFLNPIIKYNDFYSFLDEKQYVSGVYEGPLLQNGFISDNEFSGSERIESGNGEQIIFVSDIIRLIKNLNGTDRLKPGSAILDIKNFSLSNFINNILITQGARNCLKLTQSNLYKPKLSVTKSILQVFQFGLMVDVNISEVVDKFNEKVSEALNDQPIYSTEVLQKPVGEILDLNEYNSVQFDFPLVYKLKPGQLGSKDNNETRGKVKQLKAYLSFYDQYLINNTSQVGNLNELFAVNPSDERTYFFDSLDIIPGMDEFLSTDYPSDLPDVIENREIRLDRRNQFLDHLLARYCEDPLDFRALQTFYLNLYPDFNTLSEQDQRNVLADISEMIISAKRQFLEEYTELSAERALGFNYLKLAEGGSVDVWDTPNVSGFEKRVSRLLGIQNYNRRTLSDISTGIPGDGEGFHLVEHILLRPKSNGLGDITDIDELLNAAVEYTVYPDPYSFIVTIVFPSGFERDFSDPNSIPVSVLESQRFQFRNMRAHTEQLIRRELPAHVLFHIFWLDRNSGATNNLDTPSLNEFETSLRNWLEVTADPSSDETVRINARSDLIRLLNTLLVSKL